jgi:hypothetical protein
VGLAGLTGASPAESKAAKLEREESLGTDVHVADRSIR